MQLPVGAGRSARGCRRVENEVGVLGEMVVFRVVNVVVLVLLEVGEVDDGNDDDEGEEAGVKTRDVENP